MRRGNCKGSTLATTDLKDGHKLGSFSYFNQESCLGTRLLTKKQQSLHIHCICICSALIHVFPNLKAVLLRAPNRADKSYTDRVSFSTAVILALPQAHMSTATQVTSKNTKGITLWQVLCQARYWYSRLTGSSMSTPEGTEVRQLPTVLQLPFAQLGLSIYDDGTT